MLKKLALGLVLIAAVIMILAALKPDDFTIKREIVMNAAPAAIFPLINDFHAWTQWSPWDKMDPAMSRAYEGAPMGVGAIYKWKGNGKVGEGTMTITASENNTLVGLRLDFETPMKATNQAVFDFIPEGPQTRVVWTMTGKANFISKLFQVVMNMDKLVGADFERGLKSLKTIAEAAPKP